MAQTVSIEMSVKVPLPQLWAAFKDLPHLVPRLLPGFVVGTTTVEGDGGVGSVLKYKLGPGVPGLSSGMEQVEAIDEEEHVYTYKVLGGEIEEIFSLLRLTWRFTAQHTGTDVNWTIDFVPLKEKADLERLKDSGRLLMKQLESHLVVTGEYSQPSPKDIMRQDLLTEQSSSILSLQIDSLQV